MFMSPPASGSPTPQAAAKSEIARAPASRFMAGPISNVDASAKPAQLLATRLLRPARLLPRWGLGPSRLALTSDRAISRLCAWNIRCNNRRPDELLSDRLATLLLAFAACQGRDWNRRKSKAPRLEKRSAAGSGSGSATAEAAPKTARARRYVRPRRVQERHVALEGRRRLRRRETDRVSEFGELPIALKPTWVKDEVSVNKPPGCPECPDRKMAQHAVLQVHRLLEVARRRHQEGQRDARATDRSCPTRSPRRAKTCSRKPPTSSCSASAVSRAAKRFRTRPTTSATIESPDKISGVMIYIDRKPPTVTRDGSSSTASRRPAFRTTASRYVVACASTLDDKLAAIIKRQELDPKAATQTPDGELHWNLAAFLKSQGRRYEQARRGLGDSRRAARGEALVGRPLRR